MEKKESLKKKENNQPKKDFSFKPRLSGLSGRFFEVVKIILGACLLPLVYASSVSFCREFSLLEPNFQKFFWTGIISFLVIYLFLWEPMVIYAHGQKLTEGIFGFIKPLVKFAPFVLPIYAIVAAMIYGIAASVFKKAGLIDDFLFVFGFSLALHLIFSAKSLRAKEEGFLKSNYFFGFSFVYILDVFLVAVILGRIFANFSLVDFSSRAFGITGNIYYAVFRQLFLR